MHSFPTSAPTITALRLSRNSSTLSIPSIAPKYPLVALRDLEKNAVSVPYVLPQPTDDTNWTLAFEKSADILLVGSWAPKTAVKANDGRRYGVDVAVTMPEVCCSLPRGLHSLTLCQTLFQEKDYLHSRLFHKRACRRHLYKEIRTRRGCAVRVHQRRSPYDCPHSPFKARCVPSVWLFHIDSSFKRRLRIRLLPVERRGAHSARPFITVPYPATMPRARPVQYPHVLFKREAGIDKSHVEPREICARVSESNPNPRVAEIKYELRRPSYDVGPLPPSFPPSLPRWLPLRFIFLFCLGLTRPR